MSLQLFLRKGPTLGHALVGSLVPAERALRLSGVLWAGVVVERALAIAVARALLAAAAAVSLHAIWQS